MTLNDIKSPVSVISGVGPQLSKNLAKLNVFTVGDLLQYYPKGYEDRSIKVTLDQYKNQSKIHTVARVMAHEWFGYGRMKTLKIHINDGTAPAQLICFNRAFLENQLTVGSVITVTGAFFVKYGKLQSTAFEVTKMNFEGEANAAALKAAKPLNTGILPLYHLTEGVSNKLLYKAICNALAQYAHGIDDELPREIIQKRSLLSKQEAIKSIHQPRSLQEAETLTDWIPARPTPEPAEEEEKAISGSTLLYYVPEGGQYYHLEPDCKTVNPKFLPMEGCFTYAEVNDEPYRDRMPCQVCGAPPREE